MTYKRSCRCGLFGPNEVQGSQYLFPTGNPVELEWLKVDARHRFHLREHTQKMEHFLRARLSRWISSLGPRMDVPPYLQPNTALLLVEALRFIDDAEGDPILREGEGK